MTTLRGVNEGTITAYSQSGADEYEDEANRQFLYGAVTVDFLRNITLTSADQVVLDAGAGTGFAFDELKDQFEAHDLKGIGVEPAKGMRDIAAQKYAGNDRFEMFEGSFEHFPVADRSVDMIVSTLALHWVKSLEVAATEMNRVLRDGGQLRILMIEKDDGAQFKKAIVAALKNHLTFRQVMATATLVQRVNEAQLVARFAPLAERFNIRTKNVRKVVYGSFDDHMKWWTARSAPVILEVADKARFMVDLQHELEATQTDQGIPFDASFLWIEADGKG
jgi:ubiquinone/menaquinone biosynthesis C-methylase UbiE